MTKMFFAALALSTVLSSSAALAESLTFRANLTGAAETPPNPSKGTGTAVVVLDTATKMVDWTITYSGLSGPATAAHFHGPAAMGVAAGVEVPISAPLASPITGMATLTDAQEADLKAGLWYVNVHTALVPKGEIRGQLTH
jgi:hypothetical protein